MSTASTIPAIRRTLTIGVPVEQAFRVFTDAFDSWWPPDYHLGEAEMAEAILEPREGGRWYERGVDGSECEWGRVLIWEPPHRVVLAWQVNGQWKYDPDPEHACEIELRFIPDGPGQTVVELEHRDLDKLVGGQAIYDMVTGAGGWTTVLDRYAKAATSDE